MYLHGKKQARTHIYQTHTHKPRALRNGSIPSHFLAPAGRQAGLPGRSPPRLRGCAMDVVALPSSGQPAEQHVWAAVGSGVRPGSTRSAGPPEGGAAVCCI